MEMIRKNRIIPKLVSTQMYGQICNGENSSIKCEKVAREPS
jgi:hypothetical protein